MLSVTFHGTAASSPTPSRGLPAISVQADGDVLLLDCGEGTQRQMMLHGVSYAKVKAIFISHLHLDHFLGVFGLLETLRLSGRAEPVELFGPRGSNAVFGSKGMLKIHEISPPASAPAIIYEFGGYRVLAFPVSHGPRVDAFGYIVEQKPYVRFHEDKAKKAGLKDAMFTEIQKTGELKIGKKIVRMQDITYIQKGKKIIYAGDTMQCGAIADAAAGADLLIHESTFCLDKKDEAKEKYHSTASDAAKIAKKAKVSHLALTHISGRYSDDAPLLEEASKIFKGKISVAKDGMKIEI